MWVATAASSSDLPCASRAERSASPMVLSRGHPFIRHIGAMRRIASSDERIFTQPGGYGNRPGRAYALFADDLAVTVLAAAELPQLLHGPEHVAGLGALRRPDH